MLNRVNIQYSIDLDDLPDEVDRIYSKARKILEEISLPDKPASELLSSEVLKQIDDNRKKLTSLDHILSDVAGIVGSFVEYEVSQINISNQNEMEADDSVEMPT